MKKLFVMISVLLVMFIGKTSNAADIDWDKPDRKGFTFEVGIAEGLTQSLQTPDGNYITHVSQMGFSSLPSVSLGLFANKDTAVMLREMGTSYNLDNAEPMTFNFVGSSFQHWVGDHFFFGAGIGMALYGQALNYKEPKTGLGFTERLGFSMVSERHISVALTFDMLQGEFSTPHNLPDTWMGGETLGLSFQYY